MGIIKSKLIAYAISQLVRFILQSVDSHTAKVWIDDLIDIGENRFSDNPLVMRAFAQFRAIISVPDDIGGDED